MVTPCLCPGIRVRVTMQVVWSSVCRVSCYDTCGAIVAWAVRTIGAVVPLVSCQHGTIGMRKPNSVQFLLTTHAHTLHVPGLHAPG